MRKCSFEKLKFLPNSKPSQLIHDSRQNSKVTSKYFKPTEECAMESDLDESKEFVQKKPTKKVVKKDVPKRKVRKKANVKSHDLRKYAKDFDKVCKANSVDVDPEELQLAIALSKSISDCSSERTNIQNSNSNDTGLVKIRKTLEQFGFKIKSTHQSNTELPKKIRHKRGDYQLLKRTNREKQQIIDDKIALILIESLTNETRLLNDNGYDVHSEILKESLCSTNSCFDKNNLSYKNSADEFNNYYVHSLIAPSSSKVGCLLKDWRAIPGREKSPERQIEPINIQEHILYKNHFDLLLSGKCSEIYKEIATYKSKELPMDDNRSDMIVIHSSRSNSPDIFGDTFESYTNVKEEANITDKIDLSNCDEDLETLKEKVNRSSEISVQNCSYSDKNDSLSEDNDGIIHYESYYESSFIEIDSKTSKPISSFKIIEDENNINMKQDTILNNIDMEENRLNTSYNMNDKDASSFDEIDKKSIVDDKLSSCSDRNYCVKDTFNETVDRLLLNDIAQKDDLSQVFVISDDELNYSEKPMYQDRESQAKFRYFISSDEDDKEDFKLKTIFNQDLDHSKKNVLSDESNSSIDEQSNINMEPDVKSKNFGDSCLEHFEETLLKNVNKRDSLKILKINSDEEIYEQSKDDPVHSKMYRSSILDSHKSNSINNEVEMNTSSQIINKNDKLNSFSSSKSFDDIDSNKTRTSIHNSLQESTESSEVFVISDDELDYSVNKLKKNCESADHRNESIASNNSQLHINEEDQNIKPTVHSKMYRSSILDTIYSFNTTNIDNKCGLNTVKLDDKSITSQSCDLYRTMMNEKYNVETPENSKYVLKTENVTPLIDYTSLGSPDIVEELSKYGLKPIKRKRAVQILDHIYEQTHPTVNIEDLKRERKKRKLVAVDDWSNDSMNDENVKLSLKEVPQISYLEGLSNIYEKDCNNKQVKYIDYNMDDVILPLRKKFRVYGCSVPLHIAFHNYLAVRSKLRDAVLRYEPIDIEMVHRGLKENGFNYNPKDLMKFMDKKCVTIKINAKEQGKKGARIKK